VAEILVYLYDREGADIYCTAKLCQRGDVLVAMEDGWQWGGMELADPMFQVIKVPDATVEDFQPLLSYELPLPGNEEDVFGSMTNTLQFRGFHIVVGGMRAMQTADPPPTIDSSLDEVRALTVQKPPIPDPAKIGDSEQVIG
jgi:hypothetical protein